jgi:hypothetical protein
MIAVCGPRTPHISNAGTSSSWSCNSRSTFAGSISPQSLDGILRRTPLLWLPQFIAEGGSRVSPTVWRQSVPAVAFHAQSKSKHGRPELLGHLTLRSSCGDLVPCALHPSQRSEVDFGFVLQPLRR